MQTAYLVEQHQRNQSKTFLKFRRIIKIEANAINSFKKTKMLNKSEECLSDLLL
jgi:hypothetical protein